MPPILTWKFFDSQPHNLTKKKKMETHSSEEEFETFIIKNTLIPNIVPHSFVYHSHSSPSYCNVCRSLMWGLANQGLACEYCGFSVCEGCTDCASFPNTCSLCTIPHLLGLERQPGPPRLDKILQRKFQELDPFYIHHFVEGNVSVGKFCILCEETVSSLGSEAYRCSRCKIAVHSSCLATVITTQYPNIQKQLAENENESNLSNLFIPRLSSVPLCHPRHYYLLVRNPSLLKKELQTGITPLIVLVNSRSGGQQGHYLLSQFRRLLSPVQVFDLDKVPPLAALQRFSHIPNVRVMVCGGDGTVGWVLNAVDEYMQTLQTEVGMHHRMMLAKSAGMSEEEVSQKPIRPPVAVLPLGTGNDMARVLNWGGGYTTGDSLRDILDQVEIANIVALDRWTVEFIHYDSDVEDNRESQNRNPKKARQFVMNNYFSCGVDAQVALDFHCLREDMPLLCSSRFGNKAWYFVNGVKAMIKEMPLVDKLVQVEVNGRNAWIPEDVECIVVLNVPSYAGGSDLWGNTQEQSEFITPSIGDGLLEVVAVKGCFHMGQIQINLTNAFRIAQGDHIIIRMNSRDPLPVQIDGEPWMQERCEIRISLRGKATMLKSSKETIYSSDVSQYFHGTFV